MQWISQPSSPANEILINCIVVSKNLQFWWLSHGRDRSASQILDSNFRDFGPEIIKQFYSLKSSVPKKIFLPKDFDFQKELSSDLRSLGIKELKIELIQKGKKLKLIELAEKNAKMQFEANFDEDQQLDKNLKNLKKVLSLKQLPLRIECFDISNTQGTNAVASMVTFKNIPI